jgi:cellobiose phosphorylase
VFSYCEFTTESFYEQDLVNMQYTQFITQTEFRDDHLLERINIFCNVNADGENGQERFVGLAGSPVISYTGRRERFLGQNRFRNPQGVINGKLDNSLNFNGNPCGGLHTVLTLTETDSCKPGMLMTALSAHAGLPVPRVLVTRNRLLGEGLQPLEEL